MSTLAQRAVTLASAEQLLQWVATTSLQRAPLRVRLNVSPLSDQERCSWQVRLERSHNECGCAAATLSLLGYLAVAITYAFMVGFPVPWWIVAPIALAAGMCAVLAGKLVGLSWARRELRRDAWRLVTLLQERAARE